MTPAHSNVLTKYIHHADHNDICDDHRMCLNVTADMVKMTQGQTTIPRFQNRLQTAVKKTI